MGLRFRKRIKLAPGLNLNIGLGGVSLSAGVRGANVTVGKRGVRGNVGIPGSGLSYSEQLMSFSGNRGRAASSTAPRASTPSLFDQVLTFRLSLDDGMNVMAELDLGNGYNGDYADKATWNKLQAAHGARIRQWLEDAASDLNAEIDNLAKIHEASPAPRSLFNQITRFTESPPELKLPEPLGLMERMNPFANKRFNEQTNDARVRYANEVALYDQARAQHELYMRTLMGKQRQAQVGNIEAMEDLLSDSMGRIDWPKETLIDFEFSGEGTLMIQVDLPEIEDIPTSRYSVKDSLSGLSGGKLLQAERLNIYKTHAFGIIIRIVSHAFALLPTVQRVVVGAYTQRRNSNGDLIDEDVMSLVMTADEWESLYEGVIVDPLRLLYAQSMRVKLTSTGKLSRIIPLSLETA